MKLIKIFWSWPAIILASVTIIVACSGDSGNPLETLTGTTKVRTSTGDGDGDGSIDGDQNPDLEAGDDKKKEYRTIDNSGANFQVKNIDLLRSSLESCMGDGMLTVTDEMILPLPEDPVPDPLPDGKERFLVPGSYAVGDDVIEKNRKNLVDIRNGNRTGIAADGLTDTYLRSLETIANVVAHNCSRDNENCHCQGTDEAMTFLQRCMPGLDPQTKEMAEAAEFMGAVCREEKGPEGMRKAIASMLSSYAFASAR